MAKVEESRNLLTPVEGGTDVTLDKVEFTQSKANKDMIVFTFVTKEDDEFPLRIMDIFDQGVKPGARKIRTKQALGAFGGFMSDEAYAQLKEIDFEGFEDFYTRGVAAMNEHYEEIKAKILVGYGDDNYLEVPAFENFISTELRPKTLGSLVGTGLFYKKQEVAPNSATQGMVADDENPTAGMLS